MKTHLIFCCSSDCLKREMRKMIDSLPDGISINTTNNTITSGEEEHLFFININDDPERIIGLQFHSFRVCNNYNLDERTAYYVRTHLDRE